MRAFLGSIIILTLLGCSGFERPILPDPTYAKLPFVHRIDIQQGNVVSQEMVAQLQLGMDKKKVLYVMGTPIIQDTFNSQRWDYIYMFQPEGEAVERRQITLWFENDVLASIGGDVTPAAGRLVVDTRQDTTVEVPGFHRKGVLGKIKDSIPFVGDDEPEPAEKQTADADGEEDDGRLIEDDSESSDLDDDEDRALVADGTSEEGDGVIVPADAPKQEKKKGFFKRIFDSVGLGAEDDGEEPEFDPGDPRYRDPTSPDNPAGT